MICDWSEGCTVKPSTQPHRKALGAQIHALSGSLARASRIHAALALPSHLPRLPIACRAEPKLMSVAPTRVPRLLLPYNDSAKSIQLFPSL